MTLFSSSPCFIGLLLSLLCLHRQTTDHAPQSTVEVNGHYPRCHRSPLTILHRLSKDGLIWGDLVPYGKVWRTGANEATTFETDKDIMIKEQKLPAGKYALFTIPGETEWTWIFNSVWDQWGAYKYDESKDVLRVKSTPESSSVFHEQLKI